MQLLAHSCNMWGLPQNLETSVNGIGSWRDAEALKLTWFQSCALLFCDPTFLTFTPWEFIQCHVLIPLPQNPLHVLVSLEASYKRQCAEFARCRRYFFLWFRNLSKGNPLILARRRCDFFERFLPDRSEPLLIPLNCGGGRGISIMNSPGCCSSKIP